MAELLREKAYRLIKNKVVYFELKPGDRILESKLAQDLKMGRMPVREAMARLESERLIVRTKGYGYTVNKLKNVEIKDYLEIRARLENLGVTLLIERATDKDIARMKKHVEKAVEIYKNGSLRKIIQSDTRFHDMMYRATKSEAFYDTISSLSDKTIIMRAAALQTGKGREMSIKDHIEMMKAIEKRDLVNLQGLVHEHIQYAPNHYESIRGFLFS
ncbi:MAG: GntR family transcriptional regulator [Desulfobacteraceae bacterium]|nr:GntR family transcriptional regulator [Desulfobacteraceae bacterium]